jgi:hypothetical protein
VRAVIVLSNKADGAMHVNQGRAVISWSFEDGMMESESVCWRYGILDQKNGQKVSLKQLLPHELEQTNQERIQRSLE